MTNWQHTQTHRMMNSLKSISIIFLILPLFLLHAHAIRFDIQNNCSYTLWPAVLPHGGGRRLDSGQNWTLDFQDGPRLAKIWARTNCTFNSSGQGSCLTGDCGASSTAPPTVRRLTPRRNMASTPSATRTTTTSPSWTGSTFPSRWRRQPTGAAAPSSARRTSWVSARRRWKRAEAAKTRVQCTRRWSTAAGMGRAGRRSCRGSSRRGVAMPSPTRRMTPPVPSSARRALATG